MEFRWAEFITLQWKSDRAVYAGMGLNAAVGLHLTSTRIASPEIRKT